MKVALVHDYLKEFGGAERVLKALVEIFPKAPIYTAFCVKDSSAEKRFKGKEVHENFLAPLLKIDGLYSIFRFLAPAIWKSFDLSGYDIVIASSSWYITRGFRIGPKTKVICYCHTPPRWLYGYETSVQFQKYFPVKIYASLIGHFMRIYDWKTAQEIKYWIANSENVKRRIKKFYRKDSVVIYPPVEVREIVKMSKASRLSAKSEEYFLIVSRLVGAKGLEEVVNAFQSKTLSKYKLKIVGEAHGFCNIKLQVKNQESPNIEFLGRVEDEELWKLYAKAKGFIALAKDEDFGMTVVEAMAAGTPVIAYNGGGFRETVIDEKTGILINDTDVKTIEKAIKTLEKIKWNKKFLQKHAKKFSKEKFKEKIKSFLRDISR